MRSNVCLWAVGEDFEIKVRGYSGKPQYKVVKKFTLEREKIQLKIRKLKKIIRDLQKRYPKKGYYLVREKVHYRYKGDIKTVTDRSWRTGFFWILGRKEEGKKNIPLYYSSTLGKVFVPSSYVKKNYRLVCSVITYRFRDFGIPLRSSYA